MLRSAPLFILYLSDEYSIAVYVLAVNIQYVQFFFCSEPHVCTGKHVHSCVSPPDLSHKRGMAGFPGIPLILTAYAVLSV